MSKNNAEISIFFKKIGCLRINLDFLKFDFVSRYPSVEMFLALILSSILAFSSCMTPSGREVQRSKDPYYTLWAGKTLEEGAPLPKMTPIFVRWHDSQGGSSQRLAFRGYDFVGDERYEMIEVISAEGTVQRVLFDYDGDGRVDEVQTPEL